MSSINNYNLNSEITDILKQILTTLKRINSNLFNDIVEQHCDFDTYLAFTWHKLNGASRFYEIRHPKLIDLDDLIGIDKQKQILINNTQQFIYGCPTNNVLLWGAKGTGKSSIIKGLLSHYHGHGLRIVEVDRKDLVDISAITATLRTSDKKFILFCDDLSFESADVSYKALKVALDGGMASVPENVVIYATSNRRHLLPEMLEDNYQTQIVENEIHHGDAVEEKMSLSERFGIWLAFYPFNDSEYLNIVAHWVKKFGMEFTDQVAKDAIMWSRQRASKSGRCAYQYAINLLGKRFCEG